VTVTETATLNIYAKKANSFLWKWFSHYIKQQEPTIWVTPKLRPFINVTPQNLNRDGKWNYQDIQIEISVPASTLPSTVNGSLFVRYGKIIIPSPLKIKLGFFWDGQYSDNTDDEISFVYPTFGRITRVVSKLENDESLRYLIQVQTDNGDFVDEISISILDHIGTPDSWILDNIDPNGVLLNSGAFSRRYLDSGIEALVLTGIVPQEYGELNGPISAVFASNPEQNRLAIANISQDSRFVLTIGDEDPIVILQELLRNLEF